MARPSGLGCGGLVLLLALALLARVVALGWMGLIPEEAYYWMYAQNPSLSYYDHPPMVAWVIGAGTWLVGHTELGVRAAGHLLMLGASVLMFVFGRMWFGRPAGVVAAVLLQTLPVYFGMGLIATMESALVFFWLLGLIGVSVALKQERRWGWYLAGAALGAALLSKYTALFLGLGTLLVVLAHRPWRRHLATAHPYLAGLLAVAMFSPVLIWNAQHDWASFRFQFVDRSGKGALSLQTALVFVGFQLLVATPLLLAGAGWLMRRLSRRPRRILNPRWLVVASFSLPLLIVVAYKSLHGDIRLSWTAPAYLSWFPAVSWLLVALWQRRHGIGVRAAKLVVGACLAVNIGGLIFALTLQPRLGWISALGPWREMAAIVEDYEHQIQQETGRSPLIIACGKYRLASVLAFYRAAFKCAPPSSATTTSQWILAGKGLGFRYWTDRARWIGRDCIVVCDCDDMLEAAAWFESFDLVRDARLDAVTPHRIAIGRRLLETRRDNRSAAGEFLPDSGHRLAAAQTTAPQAGFSSAEDQTPEGSRKSETFKQATTKRF